MSNIIILGDPHIGRSLSLGKSGIGTTLNSRVIDQLALLNFTLETAINNEVFHIFITGDVFEDTKPHPSFITLFINWVKKCEAHDIYVHIIMGNHDFLRSGNYYVSSLDIINECDLSHCTVYKNVKTLYINNVAFTLVPFRDRKSFDCEVNADATELLQSIIDYEVSIIPISYPKVLIGHLAIEGSIPIGDEIDDLTNELFCPLSMFLDYDYVWMGHIHKPQIMNSNPHVAHIGSMDISNFGETDHKKSLILFDTDNVSFTTIDLPTRNLEKIVISIPKDTDNSTQYVLDEIKNKNLTLDQSIIRLEVSFANSDIKPINRSEIEKFLRDAGVDNISGFSESRKINLVKNSTDNIDTEIDNTADVPSAIKKWAKKKWPNDADKHKRLNFISGAIGIYNDYKAGVKA